MHRFTNFLKSFFTSKKTYSLDFVSGRLPSAGKSWSSADFLNSAAISLYVNRAIAKRADKVSEIEFELRDKNGKEIEKDPMLDLLYRPNKVFTGRQFWGLFQKYYDCVGEVYILLRSEREIFESKRVKEMHLLIPTLVKPIFDDFGMPEKYEYQLQNKTITYKPEEILYVHNPDPVRPLRGQSLLKAGVNAINTEIQISTYHSRVLENGGKVEGVFKFNTMPMTEEQLEKIKAKYRKEYATAKRAGLPLFLGGGADYTRTGLTPEELSFLDAKKMTLEDICILTGVPRSVLASTNDVKFDNADADRAIFLRETIKPLLVNLTSVLDEVLFPDDRFLTFVDPTPENIEEKLKETESGIKNYYMTINEARERHGLDPITDGDEIMIPFSVMPLGTEPEKATAEEKKIKSAEEGKHPLQDFDIRRMWWKMQIKRMTAREKKFKNVLTGYLDDQKNRLIEKLDPKQTRVFRRKGLLEDTLSITLETSIGRSLFIPVLSDLLAEAGVDALELAGSSRTFNLSSDIASWIEKRADIFLNQINETTFKTLKDQFEESFSAGEDRGKLVNRIRETYNGISDKRANVIARTEVHNSTQYGTMQGYKQAGLQIKVWVAVMDDRTRDSHASQDGEERPIDMPFSNGLMFPGDPNGPAGETINCRCVI